jgi:hypothetical protein
MVGKQNNKGGSKKSLSAKSLVSAGAASSSSSLGRQGALSCINHLWKIKCRLLCAAEDAVYGLHALPASVQCCQCCVSGV